MKKTKRLPPPDHQRVGKSRWFETALRTYKEAGYEVKDLGDGAVQVTPPKKRPGEG